MKKELQNVFIAIVLFFTITVFAMAYNAVLGLLVLLVGVAFFTWFPNMNSIKSPQEGKPVSNEEIEKELDT